MSTEKEMLYWKAKLKASEETLLEINYKSLRKHIKGLEAIERTPATIRNHITVLLRLAEATDKPFQELTESEVDDYFDTLKLGKASMKLHKSVIRSFLRTINPDASNSIKTAGIKNKLTPADMFKLDDIHIMVSAAEHARDKALIACYFDAGCRKSELLSVTIKDIEFDSYGCKMWLRESKTFQRAIRLTYASAYLSAWISCHPLKNNPDAHVFCSTRAPHGLISNTCLYHIVNTIHRKTGKRPMPRMMRHSRATDLVKKLNGSEQQLKLIMGWFPNSNQTATYVHLSGELVDDLMLEASGVDLDEKKKAERQKSKKTTYVCLRCHEINPITEKKCLKCGFIEDEPIITKDDIDSIRAQLEEMRIIKDVFVHAQTAENENIRQAFAALAKMIVDDEKTKAI
jgi:integrase/recombinase XerD